MTSPSNQMFTHPLVLEQLAREQQQQAFQQQLQMMPNPHHQMISQSFYPPLSYNYTSPEFYSPSHNQLIYNNQGNNKFASPSQIPQYPNPMAASMSNFHTEQDQNLDCLASLVYKKLLMKKKSRGHVPECKSTGEENNKSAAKSCLTRKVNTPADHQSDDLLIQMVNGSKKTNTPSNQNNNLISFNNNNNISIDSYNENEESKLIEDLFFIK